MRLTLNSLSALRVIRAIRTGELHASLERRCDFVPLDRRPAKRLTRKKLAAFLSPLGEASAFSNKRPLRVLVDNPERRVRTRNVKCTIRTTPYPPNAFISLGGGITISGPELTFIELARIMTPATHLLLGMELCGCFSRTVHPRGGEAAYDLQPATTVERLRAFAQAAPWIRGAAQALVTIDRIVENAWSPMEALLATLMVLPAEELGYDIWPIVLNPRKRLGLELARFSGANSRVPDIMFKGTNVGINYDGEGHFASHAKYGELGMTRSDMRRRFVLDKRRDRDLLALGLSVFSVTREDLNEVGGFDRVMGQLVVAIENEQNRSLSAQRRLLHDQTLAHKRQQLIWSLMSDGH